MPKNLPCEEVLDSTAGLRDAQLITQNRKAEKLRRCLRLRRAYGSERQAEIADNPRKIEER
jgi:hypothetical protein